MKTPTYDDFLHSMGLTRIDSYSARNDWATPVMLFGAGVLTGAAIALLSAPKSGRELRGDIATTANQLGNTVAEALPDPESVNPFSSRKSNHIEAK